MLDNSIINVCRFRMLIPFLKASTGYTTHVFITTKHVQAAIYHEMRRKEKKEK